MAGQRQETNADDGRFASRSVRDANTASQVNLGNRRTTYIDSASSKLRSLHAPLPLLHQELDARNAGLVCKLWPVSLPQRHLPSDGHHAKETSGSSGPA